LREAIIFQYPLKKLLIEIEPDYHALVLKTYKPLDPLLIVLAVCAIAITARADEETTSAARIAAICRKHGVPALAVVATKDGRICDRTAAGVRKWGDPTPVTTNDVFHIGSCTKSMTATLAAMFIEQGKLRWDTTIAEVFPELKSKMDKRYEAVTVEQLLHHRGGVPHDPPAAAWARAWLEIGTSTQQRREYLASVLSAPPEAEPGTEMIYSNDGYVIVGAMLEKISGQDFESLMTEKLFKPLHMDTAGFGPPGTKDKVDQPWGHLLRTSPMQSDNPPVHSPCGRVHCSLDDLARYALFHLQHGTNSLLKPETMAKLHASLDGKIKDSSEDYACGWVRMKRGWAGGTVLWHNGSNTMWYIVMWLAPEKDFCVIAATNVTGDEAEKACDDAAVEMIGKWLPK
jgi:CubicO group peptidase (beta-lactamase class C family)